MNRPTLLRSPLVNFDEFCKIVREGQKADLIDGVIYMASPDNFPANRLCVWLTTLLELFSETKDLGEIYGSRAAFRVNDTNSPEPDIAFIRKERLKLIHPGYFDGGPDLAVEIVSPDSVGRDYEQKRALYRRAGVREYWIVDPLTETITLLRLSSKGRYKQVRPKKGIFASEVLPGFWLRPEWLWQDPRPKKRDVLTQILSGTK